MNTLIEKIKRLACNIEDLVFDKFNRVETGGIIFGNNLISDKQDSVKHATAYHAAWCRSLRELFLELSKMEETPLNFVDVGSGKGKACFYASKKNLFKNIIGVEFSKMLVDIANTNNFHFKASNIQFICGDAAEFELPDGQSLVFLFNPFNEVILDKFIKNNINRFKQTGSIIAYANDVHRKVLAENGFETVFRNQIRKISLHKLF